MALWRLCKLKVGHKNIFSIRNRVLLIHAILGNDCDIGENEKNHNKKFVWFVYHSRGDDCCYVIIWVLFVFQYRKPTSKKFISKKKLKFAIFITITTTTFFIDEEIIFDSQNNF